MSRLRVMIHFDGNYRRIALVNGSRQCFRQFAITAYTLADKAAGRWRCCQHGAGLRQQYRVFEWLTLAMYGKVAMATKTGEGLIKAALAVKAQTLRCARGQG